MDGCQPFWLDWVWRLLNEVDNSSIAFVNWHYYAEWRDYGEGDAASDARAMQNLLMAQTHQYGLRAAQAASEMASVATAARPRMRRGVKEGSSRS